MTLPLVLREDHRVFGRVNVEADGVAHLELEFRVGGDLEGLRLVRPETVGIQDAVHGGDDQFPLSWGMFRTPRPVASGCALRWLPRPRPHA